MKKTFNILFLLIWPAIILSQFGTYQTTQKINLKPLNINITNQPNEIEKTIIDTESISKTFRKIKFKKTKSQINQKINLSQSSLQKTNKKENRKNVVIKAERKIDVSDYSPRPSQQGVEITGALTLLEIKKQIEENNKRRNKKIVKRKEIIVGPKTIAIKDISLKEEMIVQEIVYNKIDESSENEINTKKLVSHNGFKIEKTNVGSWLALLKNSSVNSELKKLAETDKKERLKDLAEKKKKAEKQKRIAETKKIENKLKSVAELPNERRVATLNTAEEIKQIINSKEDELVFLDYSKDEKTKLAEEEQIIENLQSKLAMDENMSSQGENKRAAVEVKKVSDEHATVYNQGSHEDNRSISSLVKNTISREMENSILSIHANKRSAPIGPVAKRNRITKMRSPAILAGQVAPMGPAVTTTNKVASIQNYRQMNPTNKIKDSIKKLDQQDFITNALAATQKNDEEGGNSRTIIRANEIILNSSADAAMASYELAPSHDLNQRVNDNGEGIVNLNINLSNSHSVFRGTILKRGMMRTIINLILEPGTMSIDIPIFSQETMSDILEKHNLDGRGGFALLELDEEIDTLDIDAGFDKKLFYNENFKEVETMGDATYVLYLGIIPGNTLLKVRTVNNHYAEKVIHVVENEVLFETPLATDPSEQMLILKERNILAKEAKDLEIFENEIKYFNRNIKATQEASNMYKMKMPSQILGMRKYLEFSHIGETIYVGTWDQTKLEIPSKDFIESVMGTLELDNLKGRCLIQVNLQKEIKALSVSGDTIRGPMNLQEYYLDKDGTMTDEITELVKKAFFVGDLQGLINMKVDYLDGTQEYLQSFCSDETYLVEHL